MTPPVTAFYITADTHSVCSEMVHGFIHHVLFIRPIQKLVIVEIRAYEHTTLLPNHHLLSKLHAHNNLFVARTGPIFGIITRVPMVLHDCTTISAGPSCLPFISMIQTS